jgi:7-carboxy-7-deazaguanine synthase
VNAPTDPAATSSGGKIVISEIFGPTFQGEGPSVGRVCSFLRLGGCNLHCRWCDTPYTWDWLGRNGAKYQIAQELSNMDWRDAWQELQSHGTSMIVVTGGEPLLQQRALRPLLEAAKTAGCRIEVETAGTMVPIDSVVELVDCFSVSVKLSNSGNAPRQRIRDAPIRRLAHSGKAIWKFVACDVVDLEEVDQLAAAFDLQPIWIMPEGVEADILCTRAAELAQEVLARGWNMTTRLQILIWGAKRGV